jgi:hypothetical protein
VAIETREIQDEEPVQAAPTKRTDPLERVLGVILLVAGAGAVAWAIPTAFRYPMALAVALSITAIGAGVVWQKPWAWSGLLCLGLLLCSASIGYLLIQGLALLTFAWFFVPGAYFVWVGLHSIREGRRTAPVTN